MAFGGLLLLLQVGITGAWKERSTLSVGREMEGGHERRWLLVRGKVVFLARLLRRTPEPFTAESPSASSATRSFQ
jgi:hypothetical protein